MRILTIGDIVGRPGRVAVQRLVPSLREELGVDVTGVLTPSAADES